MRIRTATIADAEQLADYAGRLFSEGLPGILDRPKPTIEQEREFIRPYLASGNSTLLVAERADEIVGLLDFRGESLAEMRHSGIFGVSVATAHRGTGVGSALIRAMIEWAPSHGITRIELHAWENNPRALALYERLGFEHEGLLRQAVVRDGRYIDVFVLSRLLPPMDLVVRVEDSTDAPTIRAVHLRSFPAAEEADLVDALRESGHLSVSLVAFLDGELVGHVAFSPVTTGDGREGLGLAPVAVLPEARRRGVASRLIEDGLRACEASGCGWAAVLGDPAFYARFGFRAASTLGLVDEFGGGDAFQVLELTEGALPRGAGVVRFSSEFAPFEATAEDVRPVSG